MSFRVRLEPSGHTFEAQQDESILAAALRQGLQLPYGCRDGVCGACEARLLDGELSYEGGTTGLLTEREIAAGAALLCQARARSDLELEVREVHAPREIPVQRMPCRIAHIEQLAHDVVRLDLTLPGNKTFDFLAGQYIDILLKDGRRRSFSIANAPHEQGRIELHVRRVPGGEFTDFIFEQAQTKALLRLEGPLGTFFLREESRRPIIFMAGGTGFAPIKGIIEHAIAQGIERPMALYWGVRARRDLYLDALPRQWAEQYPHISYTPVLSEPAPDDAWTGRSGYVHEAVLQDHPDLSAFEVYASGPPEMVHTAHGLFLAQGLPGECYFSDAFEYARDNVAQTAP